MLYYTLYKFKLFIQF